MSRITPTHTNKFRAICNRRRYNNATCRQYRYHPISSTLPLSRSTIHTAKVRTNLFRKFLQRFSRVNKAAMRSSNYSSSSSNNSKSILTSILPYPGIPIIRIVLLVESHLTTCNCTNNHQASCSTRTIQPTIITPVPIVSITTSTVMHRLLRTITF